MRGLVTALEARVPGAAAHAEGNDALTSMRPYHETFSPGDAIRLLEAEAGCTLDPRIVTAFVA